MINWKTHAKPIVALAPMADMSDLPFCVICKDRGTPLMFREMVSAEAVIRLNPKTLKMASFDERERPLVQQIFGANPESMAQAAQIIYERFQPDAIDINMGCPVYNLVSTFNGASLIRDPERAKAIVRAMKAVVPCPVSVKTRLGWAQDTDCLEFVKHLADAGADLISLHGRTKEQGYSGVANWHRIGEARRQVPHIPFLVNGDITTIDKAKEAMDITGADGVMIGRGMLGNPWFAKRVETFLATGERLPEPTWDERVATMLEHARLQIEHHGPNGLVKLRKHLPWYIKGTGHEKALKPLLVRVSTYEELEGILDGAHQATV